MTNLPPLKALQAFEAAGRTGSFQAAAKELFVTPSAISHQIKSLEAFLGLPLFERRTRQIILTAVGESYLEGVTKSFLRMEAATDRAIRGYASGELKLAVSPLFLERWLLPRFADFADKHPDIEIEFIAAIDEIDFTQTEVDMAIYFGDGDWDRVSSTLLRRASVIPVCAPELLEMERVMDPEDLLQFRLLQVRNRSDDWQRWFSLSHTDYQPSQGAVNFANGALAVHAAKAGIGVALTDVELIAPEIEEGLLMAPMELEMELPKAYYLVTHEDRPRSPAMDAFSSWIYRKLN
ncbi:transcriptional regulator GcvA [Reinekea marinisedimentorum]|uniref:LysR family glycine cleavage system transcriptional activator n=1 Tax=Reinekea marinisedimentorum TaxID=230495 RepID=A0A4R3IAW0_9GAMM|nr:transcriptional regulator GcvA [Reinekea marinisedimentorum]TCS43114.1 LysR family glycine cleavage system transcriptional activator [Reinekea marinisedimentorum]